MTIILRRVGNSVGCTFPRALLEHLKLKEGDKIEAHEKDGKIELAPIKKIVPIKLGGLWKDVAHDMDLEDFKRLRRATWGGLGKDPS